MDGPRPSSVAAPSIWYAAVDTPQRKPAGNWGIGAVGMRPPGNVKRARDSRALVD